MIESVSNSEDLPVADRFVHLRELMSPAPVPMDARGDHVDDVRVHQRDLHLGALRAWTMTFQPMTFHRTVKLIKRSDPQTYNICLLLHGTMGRTWDSSEATYAPHDLHISDSSQPFELRADSTQGPISCIGIELPKRLLPLPPHRADQLIGKPISTRHGIGALLAQFLTHLTTDTSSFRAADAPRLGIVATDLISALFAHVLDANDRHVPPATHRQTLILRIRAFIQQHLTDPHLTPRTIAAAHHISLSYLHRLFHNEQHTVAAWIRQQRMEHARRDLADPALQPTPIHTIATRWGYPRAADFTRTFHTTYGITPTDYRHQALHTPEQPPIDTLQRNCALN